jgi:predicted dehydrogenase
MFTKNILMPVLKRRKGVELVAVAAKSSLSSAHLGRTFGFQYATTEYERLLGDESVGSVVITTRHDLHSRMLCEALRAGKHVFIEKPLCISREQLDQCIEAYAGMAADRMLMLGFNRRHSPLLKALKQALGERTAPLQILYRVNAGFVPREHWTQDPGVGGGRIIGEACHMVDALQFLTGAAPVEVLTRSIRASGGQFTGDDNVSMTVSFSDGSLGTIVYTALGSKAFSRERIEVFGGGVVGLVDDFRRLEVIRGTRRTRKRLMSQDMGYAAELEQFFSADPGQGKANLRDAIITTLTTLCAVESLQSGKSVAIPAVREIA